MPLFSYFYCRAYDYYNTSGKKSDDTLRGSAIVLLSLFQLLNILTVVFLFSFLMKKTIGNSWVGLLMAAILLTYNFLRISKEQSVNLRNEINMLSVGKTK